MGTEDFFAQLPRGKEDKPLLFGMGPLVYDFHDIDGLYFMLDRRLSGCLILMWAKPMNPEIKGKITLNGKKIKRYVLTSLAQMGHMWILGVPLRGHVTEYGKEYALRVEGFTDTDGNTMNPQDFTVSGISRVLPEKKYAEHESIALQAATEGIVLLENRGNLLPLREGTVINLFGKGIHQFRNGAVGAGKITPRYSVDLKEAIRESSYFSLNEELVEFYSCDEDLIPPQSLINAAKEQSDTAVMLITRAAGENMDCSSAKGEYYLSEEEGALMGKLSEEFSHLIVILNVGYPIDVSFVKRYGVDALLYSGFGGMLGGWAVADILSGKENPSGKLPDTWAKDYFDIPSSRNFYDCVDKPRLDAECNEYVDTCYEEGIYVGYRYFTTFHKEAAYSFGYGLSYTNFVVETEKIDYNGKELSLTVHVKNMGKRDGKEVIQIYVGKPDGLLEKPERELAAFEKTRLLQPGEEQSFEIKISKKHLTSYSEEKAAWLMEAGTYRVYVGDSVNAPLCGSFFLPEDDIIKQVSNLMQPVGAICELSKYSAEKTWPSGKKSGICAGKDSFMPYAQRKSYPAFFDAHRSEGNITFEDVRNDLAKAAEFTAQLTIEELARLSVCASAGWGMEGIGEAGRVFRLEGRDIPDFPVSDGNSGVNLRIPNIGMPSGVTICAGFNKELCEAVGRVIGEEAKELSMPMILAPALNIHRNPLNGRQPEYFSEDPYLTGVMSGYYGRGLEEAGVASCIKHLAANNCETSRKRNQSIVTERALREIYLKAFELSMEEHMPAAVMTAYNAINGVPTAADPELLLGFLREENEFDGFVMTDWTSYDTADVAAMVEAGNCWLTPGSVDDTYTVKIVEGVKNGSVQLARLQENVSSLIRTIARFF